MKVIRSALFVAVMTSALSGCVGPNAGSISVPVDVANRLRLQMPIYSLGEIAGDGFELLGNVDATSCFNNAITDRPASNEDALDQLRFKASAMRANALVNVSCSKAGTSLVKNCWQSVSCEGLAVRMKDDAASR